MRYLTETTEAGKFDLLAAVQNLAANGGPGGFRQVAHLLWLRFGKSGVKYEEYFTYALWRADRGRQFLKEFLPGSGNVAFNSALEMPGRGPSSDVINDKVQTEIILQSRGLPVTRTKALYLADGATDPGPAPYIRPLRNAADIAGFLSDPANLPVFGKPLDGSFARGAAAIDRINPDGSLSFLNGRSVSVPGLAAEIVADWAQGYMFQPFYQCHADLRRHVGPAMASVRIVTLLTDRGVEPWYGVIRVPAKAAMHDGDAFDTRIWGLIDLTSGKIVRIRNLRDPLTPDLTHWLDEDAPFLGFTLPYWDQAMQACLRGHESFRGHGIIGWDVFLTGEGALLNEANANPGHVYQVAAQRGMMNPDMAPAYRRALAFAQSVNSGQSGHKTAA
jgi:Sugar-transfer associated ATP-grasp